MSPEVELALSAVGWSILSTIAAQLISIVLMWFLGLPPKKLAREINDVQNPAVGAAFFVVAMTVGLFVGVFASDGFSPSGDRDLLNTAGWIGLALLLGLVMMWLSFVIAHRLFGVENQESTYRYIQRELIEEQNAALAFFLGGLVVPPFIAAIFQVI